MIKLAILSSNCPEWTFEQMVDAANRYGYEGVDIRVEWSHAHGLELTSTQEQRRQARRYAQEHGVAISCLALSTRLARATDAERDAAVEEVRRYAELAADLGSALLRVFGGRIPEGHTMAGLRPATAAVLGRAAEAAAPFGVTPCLEVHDEHNNPADVGWIVEQASHPNAGVVWHVAHHVKIGISPNEAYPHLKGRVRHLHTGRGGLSPITPEDTYLARAFQLLAQDGFDGYAANEWIIKQNSQMDPDVYLPAAARLLKQWRDEAATR